MSRKMIDPVAVGKQGGDKLKEMVKGTDYYKRIGEKGRQSIRENDPEFYKRLSQAGIAARQARRKKVSPVDNLAKILSGE